MMLVVFKCIIYAAFIFVIPLMLLPKGWNKYGSYLTIIKLLQLWPAINSVINMIISTYSNLAVSSNILVSFSTASIVTNHVDTITITVNSSSSTVLAYWMTNLGAGVYIVQMARSMTNSMQQVAGSIGSEVSSGNRSIDDVNENNSQRNMHNAKKTDANTQYFTDINSTQMQDGGIKRTNPDYSEIFSGGAGATTSTGSRQFIHEGSIQNQLSQGTQHSDALLDSDRRSLSDSKGRTFSSTADFVSRLLAEKEHNGESLIML